MKVIFFVVQRKRHGELDMDISLLSMGEWVDGEKGRRGEEEKRLIDHVLRGRGNLGKKALR